MNFEKRRQSLSVLNTSSNAIIQKNVLLISRVYRTVLSGVYYEGLLQNLEFDLNSDDFLALISCCDKYESFIDISHIHECVHPQ